MQADWEIKGRSQRCTRTDREFIEGESFYTLLFSDPDGYRREDLCEEAWLARNENIQPFSFWKSSYEPPPPPAPEALKKNDAEALLRHLLSLGDMRYDKTIFILALMLERKRLLRSVATDDDMTLVYEHPRTGETFVFRNPKLSLDQIPQVQKEVAELLSESLDRPAAPVPDVAPEPEVADAGEPEAPVSDSGEESNGVSDDAVVSPVSSESSTEPQPL